jgi:hypothetical protein
MQAAVSGRSNALKPSSAHDNRIPTLAIPRRHYKDLMAQGGDLHGEVSGLAIRACVATD